ncbi:hypothetical protein DFJ74DRAFT_692300 [Hyaloraphidium curvatum]|nr:hypothetical protein DFJ74DRAFT_692300 [Hyaloraphidium curvatum]
MQRLAELAESLSAPAKAAILGAAAVAAALAVSRLLRPVPRVPRGAVILVTGCDTGIGRATAELLSERTDAATGSPEFTVLAGCLGSGIETLQALGRPNLVPFRLDVTSNTSVSAMRDLAEEHCRDNGLFALCNVAGIQIMCGYTDLGSMEDWQRVFDVNTFGVLRCTRSVLHLLHRSAHLARRDPSVLRPRIITMSSIGAEIGASLGNPYAASKHATKAIMNTLRAELAAFGIEVVEFRPFFVATPMVEGPEYAPKFLAKIEANNPGAKYDGSDPYGRENPLNRYAGGAQAVVSCMTKVVGMAPPREAMTTPRWVAERMERELRSATPAMQVTVTNGMADVLVGVLASSAPGLLNRLIVAMAKRDMASLVRRD